LKIHISGQPFPTEAWWSGALDGNWLTVLNAQSSNFNTSATSGASVNQLPGGGTTNVFFGTSNPSTGNLTTTLGQDFDVNSVNVQDFVGPVSISGLNTITGRANILTIEGGGINLTPNAGGLTITSGVNLGAAQSWNNSSSTALVVSGIITGGTASTLTTFG